MQSQLEIKDSMLQTTSSAGQQLVTENDELFAKLEALQKVEKEKDDELHTLKKTNVHLRVTATRSGAEADELHRKLVGAQQRVQQLEEDNKLLNSLHNGKERRRSDDFNKTTASEMISKLEHENKTLEQFLVAEQEKCAQFFENAENDLRTMSRLRAENEDLKKEINGLNQENEALAENLTAMQSEMASFAETFENMRSENETLQSQLDAKYEAMRQHPASRARSRQMSGGTLGAAIQSPVFGARTIQSLGSEMVDESVNPHSLIAQGYSEYDILEEEAIDAPSSGIASVDMMSGDQFRNATIDAQEEFYRLTVIAAKIKFHDVPISTAGLLERVKKNNVAFHEVAEWLNQYLTNEREKIIKLHIANEERPRVVSVTKQKEIEAATGSIGSSKQFFQKIRDLAGNVISTSSTLRLEVRFGRRVFEVKMKKQDKLETLLQTLPRIIGEA